MQVDDQYLGNSTNAAKIRKNASSAFSTMRKSGGANNNHIVIHRPLYVAEPNSKTAWATNNLKSVSSRGNAQRRWQKYNECCLPRKG